MLAKDAFDLDAAFLDDTAADAALPRLGLAVEGLTGPGRRVRTALELWPEDAAGEHISPSTAIASTIFGPGRLEAYGRESSLWRKIRGYLGF